MNFYKLMLTIFLATLLLPMASAVATATIDVPDTAMQGDSWNIALDCPSTDSGFFGKLNDGCLIEWTGPTDGEFFDFWSLDNPNNWNIEQTLTIPGIYTYSIKRCSNKDSCNSTADYTDTIEI